MPGTTERALLEGYTLQPLGEGPLLAFPAGCAPKGLVWGLAALFSADGPTPPPPPQRARWHAATGHGHGLGPRGWGGRGRRVPPTLTPPSPLTLEPISFPPTFDVGCARGQAPPASPGGDCRRLRGRPQCQPAEGAGPALWARTRPSGLNEPPLAAQSTSRPNTSLQDTGQSRDDA